jgi:hypothetical protein
MDNIILKAKIMKRYFNHILMCISLLLCTFTTSIFAQNTDDVTPASLERIKLTSMWHNTANAAGNVFDEVKKYSNVDMNYQYYNGNFHRPQQAKDGNSLQFASEGNLLLNKTRVWGFFSYHRDRLNSTEFNASILDPYRGMPYYVADTVASDWRNQHYQLGFKVAQPLGNMFSVGIEGWYLASTGAKQRDPRTDNNQMTLILKPSVAMALGENHRVGLTFEYYNLKEESDMQNVNDYVDQTYYSMYGLGTAIIGLGSGRTTNYEGNNFGGSLQYECKGDIDVLLEGSYNKKVEDVKYSFTNPKHDASVRDRVWKGSAQFQKECCSLINALNVVYYNHHIDGIQTITQRDNTEAQQGWMTLYSSVRSKYTTNNVSAEYTMMKKRADEYAWKWNALLQYMNENDEYLLPHSVMKYENIKLGIGGKANIKISDKMVNRLLLGADFFYNDNLSGRYQYGGSHADYPVVTKFETTDLNYLITDFYGVNLSAVYSQKVKGDLKADIYAKANFNYTKAKDFDFNHRSVFEFSLGCNF